jgi:subtilisin family serine protease
MIPKNSKPGSLRLEREQIRQSVKNAQRSCTKSGTTVSQTRSRTPQTRSSFVPPETPIAMPAFLQDVPAGLRLPNLIAVGAVNQAGDETSFTSYGPTVVVDADGYEVESYVPGGTKLKLSGTSMASPNVANLAAKLFVVDPALTPTDVIELIRQGATTTKDGRRHLINPQKVVCII